jgi:hypothetical protein
MSHVDLRDLDAFSQRPRDLEKGSRRSPDESRYAQRGLTEGGELLLARVGPVMSDVGDVPDQVRGLRGGRQWINAPLDCR